MYNKEILEYIKMEKKKKTIKQMIKRPGELTRKAKAAGKTINQFARENKNAKGLTGMQSRFYLNFLKRKKG